MSLESYIRVAADPQLPDSVAFLCPLGFFQHLTNVGARTDFERVAFGEMEYLLDAERIGERRSAEFTFELDDRRRSYCLNPGAEEGQYYLCCCDAEWFEYRILN